jgi:hypothetical protein
MTTKELKTKIHEDIDNLEDTGVLEMMDMILDTYKAKTLIISEKHKQFLDKSNKSRSYSREEAKKLVDQWLKD